VSIITIASSKGGAGKTTIARLLLGHAVRNGVTAAAVDSDLNHSLTDWINQHHPSFEVRAVIDETQIVPMVSRLHEMHDFVVIDTAGAATQATVFAIGCADLVLVPLKLSAADVTEAMRTMALVKSASTMMGREIVARVVLTGFKPRTSVATHVEQEIASVALPDLKTRLHDLVAFEEMTFNGIVPVIGAAGVQAEALFAEAMVLADLGWQPIKLAS
jgi:chromosome partitioning protein